MFNYNGGPEISLSKNDDLYSSYLDCSQKDYIAYSSIKGDIIGNNVSMNQGIIMANNSIDTDRENISNNNSDKHLSTDDFRIILKEGENNNAPIQIIDFDHTKNSESKYEVNKKIELNK